VTPASASRVTCTSAVNSAAAAERLNGPSVVTRVSRAAAKSRPYRPADLPFTYLIDRVYVRRHTRLDDLSMIFYSPPKYGRIQYSSNASVVPWTWGSGAV